MTGKNVVIWTIYDHPADYPDHWVIRAWTVKGDGTKTPGQAYLAPSLAAARAVIPDGLTRIPALDGVDDPTIAETWV